MKRLETYLSRFGQRLNVSQKIVVGYLVLALFSLAAILFSLYDIQQQVSISGTLVNRDFRAINLIRDLRENLLTQERLEQQCLIFKDVELLELLAKRNLEFDLQWEKLHALELEDLVSLDSPIESLQLKREEAVILLKGGKRKPTEAFLQEHMIPLRAELRTKLDEVAKKRETLIDQALSSLNRKSKFAYRITFVLLILGVAIGGGVAYRVVRSINRSIRHLSDAARQASEGRFDFELANLGGDEFGHLAGEFMNMGRKLLELNNRLLDANPLTHLPGNLAISHELDRRIISLEPFAHIYIDLDHFKAYNDRYGYQKGSEVIARVGDLVKGVVAELGNPKDLVGHIGGDDYLLLSTPDKAEPLAKEIISRFDRLTGEIYTPQDLECGHYEGIDRYGEHRRYPLMSMSVAIICSENMEYATAQDISQECAKMKEHLKNLPGSNYLIDRRRR